MGLNMQASSMIRRFKAF